MNCQSLEIITFPEGTETIDGFVLGGFDNLKEVYVPASVTEFGDGSRILSVDTCPDAVVITPKGSRALPQRQYVKRKELPTGTIVPVPGFALYRPEK